jgi:glucosylceramidase
MQHRIITAVVFCASLVVSLSCNTPVEPVNNNTPAFSLADKKVWVYTTADSSSYRLALTDTASFESHGQPVETETCVFINPERTFQTFLGIGGALTDAAAETFAKLPEGKQRELLNAYFNPQEGIGYTLARTHINSCDFSSASYTYVNDGDKELKSFDISPDKQYRIPMIKRAIEAAGGKLTLYVSPWSPPAFMKDNNNMLKGGKLLQDYKQSWADYYVKFIKAYEAEQIPIWGLTVQNEPMATQKWESCIYTAEEERDFIKEFLGPTLEKSGLQEKKLVAWDHNRDLIYQRASTLLNDKDAAKYIWGLGFHWYEDWSGGDQVYDNVLRVKENWNDVNLLFTEGCNSPFDRSKLNDWKLGERYGKSMIQDFNAGAVGWTDWNILLDETGGPNHVKNFCFAPVHALTQSGELVYTNSFYYIGHFSKFIRPGAKRVQAAPSRSNLISTAFLNTDGSLVVVVMNQTSKTLPYFLWMDNHAVKTQALPHSISTFIVK